MYEFRVYGMPKPGGSKRAFFNKTTQRGYIVDACAKNKQWRDSVVSAFVDAYPQFSPLTGALRLEVKFYLPRPKNHFGTGAKSDVLKPSAPLWHISKPDATKLVRSTEDALSKFAWVDDSQIAQQCITKEYGSPGALITIKCIDMQ